LKKQAVIQQNDGFFNVYKSIFMLALNLRIHSSDSAAHEGFYLRNKGIIPFFRISDFCQPVKDVFFLLPLIVINHSYRRIFHTYFNRSNTPEFRHFPADSVSATMTFQVFDDDFLCIHIHVVYCVNLICDLNLVCVIFVLFSGKT